MSTLTTESLERSSQQPERQWYGRPASWESRPARRGDGTGWLLVGLAVVGLGYCAWQAFGPDLIRYLKIRDM